MTKKGFSLIEVLISLMIFSMGLLGLCQIQRLSWQLLVQ